MAQKTQEEDKEGILRMQRMVQQSEDVGIATNVKLKMQTEQLKNIGVDVANVNARMKDAHKLLNQIGRRMETDKFLMFFIGALEHGRVGWWGVLHTQCLTIFGAVKCDVDPKP